MAKHIAIAGNIGAGKTTLAKIIGNHLNWEVQFEEMNDNPYISDFYENMQRWSFNLQVYFLTQRWNGIKAIRDGKNNVVQDRSIYEDAYIFAPNLHAMGLMSTRDFENFNALFSSINQDLIEPDLLIYLRAGIPKLVNQIQMRGRDYEDAIRLDYLKRLNERYEAWINDYKGQLLIINTDDLEFADNPDDQSNIISQIESRLNGLFK